MNINEWSEYVQNASATDKYNCITIENRDKNKVVVAVHSSTTKQQFSPIARFSLYFFFIHIWYSKICGRVVDESCV